MGMLERGGTVRTAVIEDRTKNTMQPIVSDNVEVGSEVYLSWGYWNAAARYEPQSSKTGPKTPCSLSFVRMWKWARKFILTNGQVTGGWTMSTYTASSTTFKLMWKGTSTRTGW